MRLFDTHCHFETTDADAIAAILARARAAGVEKVLAVGGSPKLNAAAVAAASLGCLCAIGLDRDQIGLPHDTSSSVPVPSSFFPLPSSFSLAAWGEIGLDYHYSPGTRREQTALFAAQLEEARRRNLPVVVHTREAADDTIALLREIPSRGVIHCFTGTPDEAKAYLDLGFFVSISGIVTFRAADNVRETARFIPDDRILVETDSPYLAPVPMRGRANEPAFVAYTCAFLADLRGEPADAFAERTFSNAERLFG